MSSENRSEMLMFLSDDGQLKINVHLEDESVWLTQSQMVELLQSSKANISEHIRNIFDEDELEEGAVVRKFRTTAADGKQYTTNHYNLDVIISVGYRVKSHRGTQFRIWATQRLKEYIIKGFTMNDDLLKKAGGGNYFDELLERIRDIRSSEKVFWRKVLDIYATSIDYDPSTKMTTQFFQTIQNKMHWAAHGHTAAEVVYKRVDASKSLMGMTNFLGDRVRKTDVNIAKNYLSEQELNILNRIVNVYLEFAELQAIERKPMYMADWIRKLDDFLRMSDREILSHKGQISSEAAKQKAEEEYEKYAELTKNELSTVENHFIESIDNTMKKLKKRGR